MSVICDLPESWEYWKGFDIPFLLRSAALFVYQNDGWQQSIGVTAEIELAKEAKIPVAYLSKEWGFPL